MHEIEIKDEDKLYLDADTLCPLKALEIKLKVLMYAQWDGHGLLPSEHEKETNKIVEEIMLDLKPTIQIFVEKVNPLAIGCDWRETERIKYDFINGLGGTIREKYESLFAQIIKSIADLKIIEFHGSFDLLILWLENQLNLGSDMPWDWSSNLLKTFCKKQHLWDQGIRNLSEKKIRTFINMRMPENELWFFHKNGKMVLEVENMECLKTK